MENALKLIEPGTEIFTLETLETKQPSELLPYFQTNGLDALIERIRQEAMAFKGDISTDKGRKEIASYAYQVAKAKTTIDKLGKASIADLKASVQAVDKERIRGVAAIQEIQDAVRKPLTEWEKKEEERLTKHEDILEAIQSMGTYAARHWQTLPISKMDEDLRILQEDANDYQEFTERAKEAKAIAIVAINKAMENRKKYEAEKAELARLRQEEVERKQREHEEKIAAEAVEKMRKEVEAKAQEEQRKQELERQRIEREKQEAEERAARAEREKEEAANKAEADRIAAEAKAEREKQEAIQKERDRVAEQQRQEAAKAAQREADIQHQAKIHNEILEAFKQNSFDEENAKAVITTIYQGKIPHLRITY